MPGKIAIQEIGTRAAEDQDTPWIIDLEKRCMIDHALALWGEWRPRGTDTLHLEECRIIEFQGTRAGYLASVDRDEDCWIDRFYLEPSVQGRGIGSHILQCFMAAAVERGRPTIRLSVLVGNPAVDFYRRHGFAMESETAERRRMVRTAP